MKTHSSILAWEIPWTEESGGLQSMGWKGLRHNLVTKRYRCQHECVVVSCFHLQFPNSIWHWASFHVLNFHLSNFLGELSDHIFCLLFNRVVYFFLLLSVLFNSSIPGNIFGKYFLPVCDLSSHFLDYNFFNYWKNHVHCTKCYKAEIYSEKLNNHPCL